MLYRHHSAQRKIIITPHGHERRHCLIRLDSTATSLALLDIVVVVVVLLLLGELMMGPIMIFVSYDNCMFYITQTMINFAIARVLGAGDHDYYESITIGIVRVRR